MTIHRFTQRMIRMRQRIYTDSFRKKLVIGATAVIFVTFILSLYAFSIDIAMGYSQDQEALTILAQNYKAPQSEDEVETVAEAAPEEDGHGFAKPQGGATPVPIKGQ